MHISTGFICFSGYYIDGTNQRRGAIHAPCRSFENLDTFNFRNINWEIGCIVTSLRVVNVYAVEKDGNLFVGTSTNTDVGLSSNRASLADIHACSDF